MRNFYRVYSGINEDSKRFTRKFLESVINTEDFELTELDSPRANEMAKLLENSYRSMNIAFVIEWSRFAEEMSVDLFQVVDTIRKRPTHANLMYPGIGVGGYCLTKDGLIAAESSASNDLAMTVNALRETDSMPTYALDFIKKRLPNVEQLSRSTCVVAGVAYAPSVGDTMFSPVEPFRGLHSLFLNSLIDPYVEFWDEVGREVLRDSSELIGKYRIYIHIN